MSKISITKLEKLLKEAVVEVEFTKVSGENRKMPCTLQTELITEIPKGTKKANTDIISAWCTDKNAWRSFRKDSVISFKVVQ